MFAWANGPHCKLAVPLASCHGLATSGRLRRQDAATPNSGTLEGTKWVVTKESLDLPWRRGTKQAWSVQGGRWATTVRLARGEARRVGRDGDSNDGVVEERSGDGAQLPRGSLVVAQVKVATAGLVSQLVRQLQFLHQSAAPSDVAMGYGGWWDGTTQVGPCKGDH